MTKFQVVRVSELRVGSVLRSPIYDSQGAELLRAGREITAELIERLRQRELVAVVIAAADLERVRRGPDPRPSAKTKADERAAAKEPFLKQIRSHGATPYDSETVLRFASEYQTYSKDLTPFLRSIADAKAADAHTVASISESSLQLAIEDIDLFAGYGAIVPGDTDPSQHSLQVATLAMSVGVRMGLSQEALTNLGVGCLLHNVGVLKLGQTDRARPRDVDSAKLSEMTKHAMITMSILLNKELQGVSKDSLMVAYQVYERCDGSGYPSGLARSQIHPLAKIASVAETYVDRVTPRPGQASSLPHQALRSILEDVRRGQFEAEVVRALLQTVSAFPIGSFVELSDQRVGRVIRANTEEYVCPIVLIEDKDGASANATVVDTASLPGCEVIGAIATPALFV